MAEETNHTDGIEIFFTDEPIVDAILTQEELRAALLRQHAEPSLQKSEKHTIR